MISKTSSLLLFQQVDHRFPHRLTQAQLPEWHDKTIRQRFTVVEDEACWRCHKKMNPLGNPFEACDDSPTLMAMDQAYIDRKGSFKETLVALVTSDSFLCRKDP